jgi:hypothetical protein
MKKKLQSISDNHRVIVIENLKILDQYFQSHLLSTESSATQTITEDDIKLIKLALNIYGTLKVNSISIDSENRIYNLLERLNNAQGQADEKNLNLEYLFFAKQNFYGLKASFKNDLCSIEATSFAEALYLLNANIEDYENSKTKHTTVSTFSWAMSYIPLVGRYSHFRATPESYEELIIFDGHFTLSEKSCKNESGILQIKTEQGEIKTSSTPSTISDAEYVFPAAGGPSLTSTQTRPTTTDLSAEIGSSSPFKTMDDSWVRITNTQTTERPEIPSSPKAPEPSNCKARRAAKRAASFKERTVNKVATSEDRGIA